MARHSSTRARGSSILRLVSNFVDDGICDVELMIIDSYLPEWEWLVMDIYSCNDYNIFFPRDTLTRQRLEPRPLNPESVAKTTLPYMLTPFIVKTEKKNFAPERKSDRYYFSVYNARSLTISLTIYNQ